MRRLLALCAVMLLSAATQALAHRLDEYLQATTFIVDGDHVEAQMRLTPGVQVSGPSACGHRCQWGRRHL